ncbi:hypothetical protein AABD41_08135 [Staphylococcus pseudoxylosus]|uniref:hypothetical protein n=1 Tax=Staphylococcus pseudoxylosus TaxID=2282419 RepID=UPI00398B66F1
MLKTVSPYLFFNGTCREALQFYSEILEGTIKGVMTYGEANEKVADALSVLFIVN